MNINFNLNGKGLIAAALLAVSLVSASFVSVINAETSGGVVFSTPEYNVGSVVLRMDDLNPATLYGGTWELITGDATLALGDGTNQSTTLVGENDPLVPIPLHSHSVTGTAASAGAHNHSLTLLQAAGNAWYSSNRAMWGGDSVTRSGGSATVTTSGAHTHSVTGTAASVGVSNATLDVRGKRLKVNVWQKTS